MNGNELAETRRPGMLQRLERALGPAGVFFRGFLEHPRMVGSIIPSSKSTIDIVTLQEKLMIARVHFEDGVAELSLDKKDDKKDDKPKTAASK